jgi:hypothetical protein
MRLLKAVRLDDSDARILATEGGAAEDGEWVIAGSYAVCDLAQGHRTPPCHCASTFLAVASRRRCTIAEIAEIDPATYDQLKAALVLHFVHDLGAPSAEAARSAAEEELSYTADLASAFPEEVWITVNREATDEGIGERYSAFKRLMIGGHKL